MRIASVKFVAEFAHTKKAVLAPELGLYNSGGKSEALNPDSPSNVPFGSRPAYDEVIHGSESLRWNSRWPMAADWCAANRRSGFTNGSTCRNSLNGSSAILRKGAVKVPLS